MNQPSSLQSNNAQYVRSPKDQKIGLWFLIGPIALLVVTGILWTVLSYSLKEQMEVIKDAVQIVFGLIGFFAVAGMIFGIPLGILFLTRKRLAEGFAYDERSGKGDLSEVPKEILGWNWGAAGLPIVWGIYHRIYISLLGFIPVVNIVILILMGAKGNEWAWRKNKWASVDEFKRLQKKWTVWGIVFFAIQVLLMLGRFGDFFAKLPVQ